MSLQTESRTLNTRRVQIYYAGRTRRFLDRIGVRSQRTLGSLDPNLAAPLALQLGSDSDPGPGESGVALPSKRVRANIQARRQPATGATRGSGGGTRHLNATQHVRGQSVPTSEDRKDQVQSHAMHDIATLWDRQKANPMTGMRGFPFAIRDLLLARCHGRATRYRHNK